MTNIDSVLKPYADDQPKNISMYNTNSSIERIPNIIDVHTGQVTKEFQEFYDKVVEGVASNDPYKLYAISDKALSDIEFATMYNKHIGDRMKKLIASPRSNIGLDIELNLGRFQEKHRNLIGGFYVITYSLQEPEFETLTSSNNLTLDKKYTELLFTFKRSQYCLISYIPIETTVD